MPHLIWILSALADIQRAYRFLFEINPIAAKQAVGVIRQGVNVLTLHPEIGRPVEVMDPEYREWPIAFGSAAILLCAITIDTQRLS